MARQLLAGTVTLLFTDIEGSTRLLQELGRDRYVRALTEHRRLLREAFGTHGGVEVEMQGDSFHFAFGSAWDAVAAAAAAQRALAEHGWEMGPVRVRMGLHTGEPVQADGLYAGLDVHRAARVMSAGHGGQVLVSARTADLVGDDVPDGVALRDLGEHRLKDFAVPQRLYDLVIEGLACEFPALTTREIEAMNLPPQPTPVVGSAPENASSTTAVPTWFPLRRFGRIAYALVTALVALAFVAGLAAVLSARGGQDQESRPQPLAVGPNSIAVIDPKTNRTVAGIEVGNSPTRIAVAGRKVWVLNRDDQTISLIDANSKALEKTFGVAAPPVGLGADAKSVWVGTIGKRRPTDVEDAARAPGSLVELDASSRHVNRTIGAPPLPAPPARTADMGPLALGAGAIWFLSGNQTVSRIDPATATVVARMRYGGQPSGVAQPSIAVGEQGVWVSTPDGASGGALTRIDPSTNEPVATIPVPASGPVVAGLGGVWVADQWYDTESVWKIDPGSNRVVGSIRVGPLPFGIALGAGAVWATSSDGTVSRIDPASRQVTRKIRVGGTPLGIAVGAGLVWVAIA